MRKLFVNFFKGSLFGKHILLTNTASSGILMLIGELIAQRIGHYHCSDTEVKYDKEKIKQMTAVGISQGPLHHYTYLWMERVLPGNAKKTVFKKILTDQLIVSPVFLIHYFYTSYFLAGKTVCESTDLLKRKALDVYLADWFVWPPCQLINFFFVPLKYRVIYINVISTSWNVFLCIIKNRNDHLI